MSGIKKYHQEVKRVREKYNVDFREARRILREGPPIPPPLDMTPAQIIQAAELQVASINAQILDLENQIKDLKEQKAQWERIANVKH